jgi:Skp family chaperone for outer membrane proteins
MTTNVKDDIQALLETIEKEKEREQKAAMRKKEKIRKLDAKLKTALVNGLKEKGYDLATDLNEILNLIPSKLSNNDNKEELQTEEE